MVLIDADRIYDSIYDNHECEIMEEIVRIAKEIKGETNIDYDDIIKCAISEIVTDDDLEQTIGELIELDTLYTSDCENIISEYGIEDAVNEYMTEWCVRVGDFELSRCAAYVLNETGDSYNLDELIDDLTDKIIDDRGDDAEYAVKSILRDSGEGDDIELDERLKPIYDEINDLRDENIDAFKYVPLCTFDEIISVVKMVDQTYCSITCTRCPLYMESCTSENKLALEYEVYCRLYDRVDKKTHSILRKLAKYCVADNCFSLERMKEELAKMDIELDLTNRRHSLK